VIRGRKATGLIIVIEDSRVADEKVAVDNTAFLFKGLLRGFTNSLAKNMMVANSETKNRNIWGKGRTLTFLFIYR